MFDSVVGSGAPFLYDHINVVNSSVDPSTVHVTNTGLSRYYQRYLMQKALSVFDWNIPAEWDKDYFLYTLYTWGYIAIIETDKFGVIPQGCSLRGHDVYYRPTNAVITNPLLRGIKEPRIGKECTLLKLQPDYGGIMDLVAFYANLLALCAETLATNILNSKLSYVFRAKNKQQAESFKKMFDQIASGEPSVFIDKTLDDADKETWSTFSNALKENYIISDLLSDMRKIECMFDTEIGIPNANTDKRERLIQDEVNANNFETRSKCELWLEELKKACREAEEMFSINISVDWRKDLREAIGGSDNG